MLDHLRDRIRLETLPRRATTPLTATRIVTVTLTDGLYSLRALQEELFPTQPPAFNTIRPWLSAAKEGFAEQVERDIRKALGIDVAAQFARAGISLRRTNLIVVLGDTSDPDFEAALANVSIVLENASAQSQLAGHSFFWTGVFLFDSASPQARALNLQSLCSSLYAKIFLLDTRNSSGLELTAEDRPYQLLHALRYLERFPDSCGSDEEFVEWIQSSSPSDGYCSSLGGSTIYYPVDALLETACVQAGAWLLSDSLLHANNEDRHAFYVAKFKLDAGLASLSDLESDLARGSMDPFHDLTTSTSDPDKDLTLLAALESVDCKLESLAAEHEAALQSKVEDRLAEWKHLLEDYLDSIVTGENGGLRLAAAFLEDTVSAIRGLADNAPSYEAPPDPSKAFAQTTAAVKGLPSTASLAVHAIAGAGTGGYAALAGPLSTSGNLALAAGASVGILTFAGLWRHAACTKAERCFAELRGALSGKWEYLLGSAVRRVATRLLLDVSDSANQVNQEVQRCIVRSEEAVEWFATKHAAPLPRSSTIHWPLLQEREELIQAADPIVEMPGLPPSSYLPLTSGRFLWRRLAEPGEALPNAYEWHLLELAAILTLSRCRRVLDTRILLRLREDPARLRQVRDHGRLAAEPFLTARPGTGEPETSAVLEADGTDCEGVLRELEADLRPHFTRLTTVPRSSPYLIALTSISTRMAFNDVDGLGRKPS